MLGDLADAGADRHSRVGGLDVREGKAAPQLGLVEEGRCRGAMNALAGGHGCSPPGAHHRRPSRWRQAPRWGASATDGGCLAAWLFGILDPINGATDAAAVEWSCPLPSPG